MRFLPSKISIRAKPPYKLNKKKGTINTKKNKVIPSANNSFIVIATRKIQGEKHNNFCIDLGSADKISRIIVENNNGNIIPRKIISNKLLLYNNIKNIIPYLLRSTNI